MPLALRAIRLWISTLSRLAPARAEEEAARLFLTPVRRAPRRPELRRAMDVTAPLHDLALSQHELTIRLGNGRLTLWRWGTGPRVLLVHGWAGDATDMAAIGAALARAGYQAILVDLPAHGRSSGRRTSLVEWMWALRALERTLGDFEAVVAHSFGGAATTLAMAELGLETRGVVLLAPGGSPWHFVTRFADAIGLPEARRDGMLRRLAERVGRGPESLDPPRAALTLDVPALVMHDPADDDVPFSHGASIAAAWPGALLESTTGLGHRRLLRDGATISRIVEFVRGLSAPRRKQRRA